VLLGNESAPPTPDANGAIQRQREAAIRLLGELTIVQTRQARDLETTRQRIEAVTADLDALDKVAGIVP